jgi:lipopolysaccharide export system permease protein
MRQYERYLFSHLLWPTVLITVSLTGIVWLVQMLRFLDFILNRGLSLGDFLYLTGLMLPSLLLILLPITLAIAVIYTYNKLTMESELVVLNAVGISKWQLTRPAILMGVACMLICYSLSFYIAPESNQRFRDIRSLFRDKYASVLLEEEVFNNPVDGVTVFVRERDKSNNLSGIVLHDNRNPQETVTMIAEQGRVEQTSAGPRFYLQKGMRQQRSNGRVSWLAFDDYAIEIAFYGKTGERRKSAEEQSIGELFARDGLSDKEAAIYLAEATQRITWPIFAVALPLFALAVLFSSEFNRRGQARRMMVAAIGMAVLVLFYFALRSLMVKHDFLVFVQYLLVFGTAAASIYVLFTGWVMRGTRVAPMPQAQGAG